jgi:hypothetical protein
MDQLLEKLAKSKAIMDATKDLKRSDRPSGLSQEGVSDFAIPQAKYNIPKEFLEESNTPNAPYLSSLPRENTKPVGVPTVEAIKKSKLPDEIKKLMIENPIAQPNQEPNVTLSNDLIERASKLMKKNDGNYVPESAKPKPQVSSGIDYDLIREMINEAVNNALKEGGLITESTEKTNETFSFRVGKHVFEGKVTKVKKIS